MTRSRRTQSALLAVAATIVALLVTTAAGGDTRATRGNPPGLTLDQVATLSDPIAMATRLGTDDLFVAERGGLVRVLHVAGDVVTTDPTPLVSVTQFTDTNGEGGLLGLAFSPDGTKLYLHYTNTNTNTRIVEYSMSGGGTGDTVDVASRRVVFKLAQPFENHKGGDIAFGPDGRLYITLGDGGSGGDPFGNGQNRQVLLGKILRINPLARGAEPYRIPTGNPFVGQSPKRGEIWLYGVRNPWRISFDSETGDLYVADVGQGEIEEVDVLPADGNGLNAGRGVNLGWNRMEGDQPFDNGTEPANHTPPVFTYPNPGCAAVIGGYVYHGADIPALDGTYLYGDFCTGTIGGIVAIDGTLTSSDPDLGIEMPNFTLLAFGQGADGELYVLGNDTVSRVEPAVP